MKLIENLLKETAPELDAFRRIKNEIGQIGTDYGDCLNLVSAAGERRSECVSAWLLSPTVENFRAIAAAASEHDTLILAREDVSAIGGVPRQIKTEANETTDILETALRVVQARARAKICVLNDAWRSQNEALGVDGQAEDHPGGAPLAALLAQLAEAFGAIACWKEKPDQRPLSSPWNRFHGLIAAV